MPDSVKNHLPKHAQDIYREAFNHALEQYESPKKRRGNDSRETVAHKVAWSAVEKKYHKGDWVSH
ncbi:ChaB family protein [Rickettsia endosymbiont of Pantilius tunicatus]|uniref:ChaB family protein n=1 Tax=Rickettsia endosymbiont of Pantilius tunicatus TaxID=3066267 RepID=UPI00376F3292